MRVRILTAALLFAIAVPVQAQTPTYKLDPTSNKQYLADNAHKRGVVVLPDGLQYRVIKSGSGQKLQSPMDKVAVFYKGWMINGKVFDQTHGRPANFQPSSLIRGWSEALMRMREGDEWELTVPAALAYGDRGAGNGLIPPGQTLVFDLAVVEVVAAPQ
ncbi:MAG TPA: FKBP-type peptidyl-prolyl cis-trans isomerase [Rhizomicrobium sp.]|jgi:FKBP-type peptidyl-prolyl cis-trans isomerase